MELKMFLSRTGNNSKMVLNADSKQSDLESYREPPIIEVVNKIKDIEGVGIVKFDKGDIVRSGIVRSLLERLED